MRVEIFADVLLILLVSSVIFIILSLVNRSKRNVTKTTSESAGAPADDNQRN